MTVLALIATLLIEQVRPLPDHAPPARLLDVLIDFVEHNLNAGRRAHGKAAWFVVVAPAALGSIGVHYALAHFSALLALLFDVVILYLAMGFRQFSHHFTDIHRALVDHDLPRARQLMREWRGRPADDLNSVEIARLAIEEAFAASHHHVFAVLFCFALLPGPSGAILYRLALALKRRWAPLASADGEGFGSFAQRAFRVIDWLPLRMTAIGFAIAGNFEDAIYCWRRQATRWRDPELGIVLAAGAGAVGVKLGKPLREGMTPTGVAVEDRIEIGVGEEADAAFLSSTVGLAWRALVLWLLLLSMYAIAAWVS